MDIRAVISSGKRHKYNVALRELRTVDGILFDSASEAYRYGELKLMARAGLIRDLSLQPKYQIMPAFRTREDKQIAAVHYIADFSYYVVSDGHLVVEDVKGTRTPVYVLKRKLFLYHYRDIDFREIPARR